MVAFLTVRRRTLFLGLTFHLEGETLGSKQVAILIGGIAPVVDEVVATAERVEQLEMGKGFHFKIITTLRQI